MESASESLTMIDGGCENSLNKNTTDYPRKDTDSSMSTITQTEHEACCENSEHDINETNTYGSWSVCLASPTVAAFSPSLEGAANLHGWGFLQATKRAECLNRHGRHFVRQMLQIPNLYEAYAQALNRSALATLQPIVSGNACGPQKPQKGVHFISLQECVVLWSSEVTKLAELLRKVAGRDLQAYFNVHEETIRGVLDRYQHSKDACPLARQRALAARDKYLRHLSKSNTEPRSDKADIDKAAYRTNTEKQREILVSAAENNIIEKDKSSAAVALERSLRNQELQYCLLVKQENLLVRQCQRLEGMALETLELLEDDCLRLLQYAMKNTRTGHQDTLNSLKVIVEKCREGPSAAEVAATVKNLQQQENARKATAGFTAPNNFGKMLITGYKDLLFTQSDDIDGLLTNNSTGVMDADTLGLPEDVGRLRDDCREELVSWAKRLQVVRVLATFLEEVASASAAMGAGLGQLLSAAEMNEVGLQGHLFDQFSTLHEAKHIFAILEWEMNGLFTLASSLQSTRIEKLDKVLLSGDKSIKMASDNDEFLWKQLCDAARAQSKAENRYRQSTALSAKARERVKSVDSDQGNKQQSLLQQNSANKVNRHMTKSFANLVSLLPDGGEKAMKMLAPGARASIVQRHLEEADSKEVKERQLLDSAVEATFRALEAYKSNGEAMLSKFRTGNSTGWDDVASVTSFFINQIEALLATREESMLKLPMTNLEKEAQKDDWLQETREKMMIRVSESDEPVTLWTAGYMLVAESSTFDEHTLEQNGQDMVKRSIGSIDSSDDSSASGKQNASARDASSISTTLVDNATIGEQTSGKATLVTSKLNSSDLNPASWLKSFTDPIPPPQSYFVNSSLDLGTANESNTDKKLRNDARDFETEVFLHYFWSDPVENDYIPSIVDSFTCSYGGAGKRYPRLYGRLFFSSTRFIFVSWNGKKQNLRWDDIIDVQSFRSSLNQRDDCFVISFMKDGTKNDKLSFGGLINCKQTLEIVVSLMKSAKHSGATAKVSGPKNHPVPIDETLQKMEVVLSRHLRNISITRLYDTVWSDEAGKLLYKPWLERACFEIQLGSWEQKEVIGPWCGETYSQKRTIKFKVKRRTHLYIGPPVANVTQTHYCRVENNDKCVLAMTCEFEGLPYSDSFAVELRWVFRRDGENDIHVEVGIFVDFKRSVMSMIKQKIRSGTVEETTPAQKNLFETIAAACVAAGGVGVEENVLSEVEELKTANELHPLMPAAINSKKLYSQSQEYYLALALGTALILLLLWHVFTSNNVSNSTEIWTAIKSLNQRMDEMETEIKAVKTTLKDLVVLLSEQAKVSKVD